MRVVHVTPYFAPAWVYGGPPRSILGLCHGLQASGVDVEVVTTAANGETNLPASTERNDMFEGIRVHYAERAFPKRFFGASVRHPIRAALASADVCHIHGLWNVPAWIASDACRDAGVPVVISPRGMLQPPALARNRLRKQVAFRLLEKRRLDAADRVHATVDAEADVLRTIVDPSRVIVIPNGVTVPEDDCVIDIRARLGIPADSPLVLFVGRVHPIKRLDLLCAAMQIVCAGRRAARLVIAGPDEGGYLSRLAGALAPIADSFHYAGQLDDAAKWALLRSGAALVLCSDSENFGMSVAEAMAAGCPVVVTRTCPWSAVEQHGAGFWVDQSAPAIAEALSRILDDPESARGMGQRGICLIKREYAWPAIGRAMAACYEQVLCERTARRSTGDA